MDNFHMEVEHLRSIYKCSNYPTNIIDPFIKRFKYKLYVPKRIIPTVPKRKLLIVLSFLGKFSMNLKTHLHKSIWKKLQQHNIKLIFQSKNCLNILFKFKDSVPLCLCYHLIYKFQCSMAKPSVFLKLELMSICVSLH